MRCRDCSNFQRQSVMEASNEISPWIRPLKGTCLVNNKEYFDTDKCDCGGFIRK